ncbi:MAG: tetratricopeptide repeat protein [Vicinamibacterales bacterium]
MRPLLTALTIALAVAVPRAQQHHSAELGSVNFPISCHAEAQARMSRAIAMLHSFWFPEARKAFESVVAADPGCGIAYWGVALTHFGNPMAAGSGAEGQAAGWAAAQKAASIGGRSDRDRAYIDAATALFQDHATLNNRARMARYEASMKAIVDRFPDDNEAKIFHAIFRVANAPPTDLTFAQQKDAATILTRLYREQPKHPGLAHYIIHAFDSPPLANLALDAARQYAGIAPAAPHALHMPSHIFTRLGHWDESIKTNRRSADLEPSPGGKSHPMDYMVYAYLQQGRDDAAMAVIKEIGGNVSGEYIGGTLGSYNALAMPARYALERDDWKGAAALAVTSTSMSADAAVTHFAKGLGAARSGDIALAKEQTAALEKIVAALTARKDPYWPVVIDAQRIAVSAWIAHAEGRHDEAMRLAREAADREELVEKHPVTPGPLLPARELLGDILMVHNRPADALAAYEATLKREPNRTRTILGAARAAKAAGRTDAAKAHYRSLIDVMDPKSPRPELREAKAFVGPGLRP